MAITATPIAPEQRYHSRVYDIIATADADTTIDIEHGLGTSAFGTETLEKQQQLLRVEFTPRLPVAYTSQWTATIVELGKVRLAKAVAAGTSSSDVQVRVTVSVPHSLVR